jgi:very-short-patch-repair endonuclease
VIEIEGGVHQLPAQVEYDQYRFEELELRRLRILRFSNEEVSHHTNDVLDKIIHLKNEQRHSE